MLSMDKDPAPLHATDSAQIFQTGSAYAFGASVEQKCFKNGHIADRVDCAFKAVAFITSAADYPHP